MTDSVLTPSSAWQATGKGGGKGRTQMPAPIKQAKLEGLCISAASLMQLWPLV